MAHPANSGRIAPGVSGAGDVGPANGIGGYRLLAFDGDARGHGRDRARGFRKGHDGLAALVKNEVRKDPFTGTVFAFRARRAGRLKLLYRHGTGLVFAIGLERMATRWAEANRPGSAL